MRHHCSPETLTMLAIDELSVWRTARLQQHLTDCPDCRAEWESIVQTITLTRSFQEEDVPNAMQAHISSELSQQNKSRRAVPTRLLTPRRSALLVTFASVLLAALLWMPTRRSGVAFAQVVKAMQIVQTIHYHEARFWINHQRHNENVEDTECWINWQPTQFWSRNTNQKGWITLADEQHSLDYSPGKKIRVWGHQDAPNHLREELMYQVTAPTKEGKGWAIWTSGVITVEGRSLLRFYNNSNTAKTRGSETIWVDPDTLRVVRSERRQYNIPNDATYMEVRDHFRYNETLPANIFAPLTEHR